MNMQTPAPQNADSFVIQTGMAVYAVDGERIGTVMDIAGFGSTKIPRAGEHAGTDLVIQAKTGSGYFNVDRMEAQGVRAVAPLCVPFHGIQAVVPDHGVILNATIIEELRHQRDPRPARTLIPPTVRRKRFPRWLW